MAKYFKALASPHFSDAGDGRFYATITATEHGQGTDYSVTRILRRKSNNQDFENVTACYEVKANGDLVIFVHEKPTLMRVYLQGDET